MVLAFGTTVIIGVFVVHFLNRSRKRRNMRIIDTIEEFKKPWVHMRDSQRVEEMVCRLIRGGKNKLQVIADFDYTLSCYHKNNVKCETCHAALGNSTLLPKAYQEESQLLYDTYHPVELDFTMSPEDKAPFMLEWWKKSHEVFEKFRFKKQDIAQVVKESKVHLRSGADSFFHMMEKNDVPLLIFSAGLGDLVTEVIHQQGSLSKNVTVVSNFMTFDEHGISTGFQLPVIHTFNKKLHSLKQGSYFEKFPQRTHAILLGDSLGDLTMVEGVDNLGLVLKIGFLNEKTSEALPKYMEGYDIVLVDDQSLDLVNGLLRKIP